MSEVTEDSSLKERCEATIIGELIANPALENLLPKKQNTDEKAKLPRISVNATVGKEVSPGAKIHTIAVTVEVLFKATRSSQKADDLDTVMQAIDDQLSIAQARGTYGLAKLGEQPMQREGDDIRKRVVAVQIIAA